MKPQVAILMGSQSDWEIMSACTDTFDKLGVPYEARVLSAHRTHDALVEYVQDAPSRGIKVFIAGAGGAAHLAGVVAAKTLLPVLGVPLSAPPLNGMDALLSTVQMPGGIPVATFAIGKPGAVNAALFATAILASKYPEHRDALQTFRQSQADQVLQATLPTRAPDSTSSA